MKWAAGLMAFALAACQTPAPLAQPTSSWPPSRGGNRAENLIEQRDKDLERETGEPSFTRAYCTLRDDWCVLTPPGEGDIHLRLPNGSWMTRPAFGRPAKTWPYLVRLHESQRVLIGLTVEQRQNLPDRQTVSFELALYEATTDGDLTEVAHVLLVSWIDDGVQRELRSETQFSESDSETIVLTVRTSAYRLTPRDQGGDGVAELDEACSYTRVLSRTASGRYEFDASPPDCPDYLP